PQCSRTSSAGRWTSRARERTEDPDETILFRVLRPFHRRMSRRHRDRLAVAPRNRRDALERARPGRWLQPAIEPLLHRARHHARVRRAFRRAAVALAAALRRAHVRADLSLRAGAPCDADGV